MTNEQHMPHGLLPRQVGILRQILSPYAQAITRVDLFGSRSGGRYRNNSDIDLVIHGDLLEKDIDRLHTLFQESALPFSVDVKSYALTQYAPLKQHMDMTQCTLFTKGDLVLHDAENESLQEHVQQCGKVICENKWKMMTLGELCSLQHGSIQTGPFGSQLHASDYIEHGIPVVMPANIGDFCIISDSIAMIGKDDAKRLSQHAVIKGDVLFSRRGDVTKCARIKDHEVGWLCGTGCLKVRFGNESIAASRYVSHYLRLPAVKEWLVRYAVGATMPNLNTSILANIQLAFPVSIKKQTHVADFLDALDDRIQLLRETNATLEAMAQALFKSWFVDFDPVHAKAESRAPEGMDAETAALFPTEFEESELGMIPMGWKIERVDEHIELAYGKALKQDQRIDGAIVVMGSNGKIGLHNKKIVTGPGIVVGRKGNPGTVTWVDDDFFPIDTTFYVVQKSDTPLSFWKYALTRLNLPSLAADSAVPGLNRNFVYSRLFCIPSGDILKSFDLIFQSIRSVIFKNCQTAYTLTTLRDTLLPRLISGKLRLPEFAETTNAKA